MRQQMLLSLLSVSSILAAYATPAEARPWFHRVNHRQYTQEHRIAQGIQSGTLTAREAARLQVKEAKLAALEARLRVNGLTPSERAKLQRELNQLNNSIYAQKHDCNRRY
jgi:hypothetical protein